MYNTALNQIPNLPDDYKKGDFSRLLNFIRENVHQHGAVYRAGDLIKRITGEDLDSEYFMKYIEKKFYPIYKL